QAVSYDLDGTAMPTITTIYGAYGTSGGFDAFNNPNSMTVSASDGFSKTTINTYYNDTTNWYLGRLLQSQVTATAPTPQTTLTRTSSFCYDMSIPGWNCSISYNTGLLSRETVEPNTPSLRLETDYGPDSFGNKVQVTVSGVDIATRSTT